MTRQVSSLPKQTEETVTKDILAKAVSPSGNREIPNSHTAILAVTVDTSLEYIPHLLQNSLLNWMEQYGSSYHSADRATASALCKSTASDLQHKLFETPTQITI